MPAEQVEINLGILIMQIHHTVKRQIQMRIMNSEPSVVMFRRVIAPDIQIVVGVVVIRQFAHMGIHLAAYHTVLYLSLGRDIQRERTHLRMIEHTTQTEITAYDTRIVRHVLEGRVAEERTIRRDGS